MLNAIKVAKEKGMKVIAMTGKDGGQMAGLADVEIRVPHFRYADRIQEIHIKVIHILMMLIEFEMEKPNLYNKKAFAPNAFFHTSSITNSNQSITSFS